MNAYPTADSILLPVPRTGCRSLPRLFYPDGRRTRYIGTYKKRHDLQNHVWLGGDERIRTAGAAFAEPCLTTWRRRRCAIGRGAGDGDRTRDFLLGKEMLYN